MTQAGLVHTFVAMSEQSSSGYELVVAAHLDSDWTEWFDGFEVVVGDGVSRLIGRGVDQSRLHGVFARLRDLGIPLLAVKRLESS